MDNHWPNPLELQELHDAVTKRRTKATIGGRQFTIRYDKKYFYVKPVAGFTPSGHFDYDHAFDEIL